MGSSARAQPPASLPAASAFGAEVDLGPAPGRGLCLVVGHDGSPGGLVEAHGGVVVASLDGRRLLALLE